MREPRRDRPQIPAGYGIAQTEEGMLDWPVVEGTLAATEAYWMATVRPDGSPHLTPIWGVWTGQRLYVEGGDDTRWARNLAHRPPIAVGADHNRFQMTIRGRAATVTPDSDRFADIASGYAAKYPYRPEPHPFWEITPHTVLAWEMSTVDAFQTTPTRFSFYEER